MKDFKENKNKQINTNNTVMKINESQLRKIIKESVKKVLKENDEWGEITCQHLEDEILSIISPAEFEQIKLDIFTKSANKWRSHLLSQMEQILISRNGKIEDGDMVYGWLAFDCMVGPSNRGNKINLYVTQRGPHIKSQYWTDKYENITQDKAKQIITDIIDKYYDYRIKSSDLNADGLKQVLSMIK